MLSPREASMAGPPFLRGVRKRMDIGLVMLVKNEVHSVEAALAPILDQFAEVIVYDTGSTDGTQDLLRERLRIEPLPASLDLSACGNLASLRNQGFARLQTRWQMTLDADERLAPEGLRDLRRTSVPDSVGGLFLCWKNFLGNGTSFEDYKCPVFRKGLEHIGLVHDTVQPALRRAGLRADWSDAVVLEHFPDPARAAAKIRRYEERLRCAMQRDPQNPRYPWFYGYGLFRYRHPQASKWLHKAARSGHPWFPVERLNAHIVLCAQAASRGELEQARQQLLLAEALFDRERSDFEVAVNRWMGPWLDETAFLLAEGRLNEIKLPRFGC
jgi:glycosyltransferase involved in cell wall biosynthesis